MTKRAVKSKRVKSPQAASPDPAAPEADWLARLQYGLIVAAVTLIVVTPLVPCESAATLGSHVLPVMGWMVLLVVWSLVALSGQGPAVNLGPTMIAVAIFLVLHSVSAWVMADQGHARPTINALWQWISFGALFFLLRQLFCTPLARRAMVSSVVSVSFGLAALGVYQYSYSLPRMRAEFAKNPSAMLEEGGVHTAPNSPERRHFIDRLQSAEPIATFALTNSLAGVLATMFVLAAACAPHVWSTTVRRWPRRLSMLLIVGGIFGCLLLTNSRAGLIALMCGLLISGGLRPEVRRWLRWRWLLAALLLGLAMAWGAFQFGVLDRTVLTGAPKSLQYRFQYWQSSLMMLADHPWFGCGPGNFKQYYTEYKLPVASEAISDPHNFLVEVAATAGWPTLIAFVAIGCVAIGCVASLVVRSSLVNDRDGARQPRTEPPGKHASADPLPGAETRQPSRTLPDTAVGQAVVVGTVLGFLLAFPVGWSVGLPPDAALLWLGVPTAILSLWTLQPWVQSGHLPAWPLAIALAVLLINLLAAGGISYPGVGQWAWVLLALLLNVVPASSGTGSTRHRTNRSLLRRSVPAVACVIAVCLALACYGSMYRPVLAGRRHLARAWDSRRWQSLEAECLAAARADPWWADPWEYLADATFDQWTEFPTSEKVAAVQRAAKTAIEKNRHSSRLRRRYGDWLFRMYQRNRDPKLAQTAVTAYRQAIRLHPSESILHAQLAVACWSLGDVRTAHRAAAEALRLDALNPHEEMSLARRQVWKPPAWQPARQLGGNAEQMMLELRTFNERG